MMAMRRSSKDLSRPADRESVQVALATASVELDCGRMLFESNIAIHREAALQCGELTPPEGLRVARDCAYVAQLAYKSTQRLFDAFGASVMYEDNPIQRALRDIMSATRHGRVDWHTQGKRHGVWRLGLLAGMPPPETDTKETSLS